MLFDCRPKVLHKHCLQFLLGVKMAPRETENNAYAKFWGDKQRTLWYVMVFLEWSIVTSLPSTCSSNSSSFFCWCHLMDISTHKSRKNQQPPYPKDATSSVIMSLPSQVFQRNILKARHLVAFKQITTSFYSFFSLHSAWKTPASFSYKPSSCQKFRKKGTFQTEIHESQFHYQDEIPAIREKI